MTDLERVRAWIATFPGHDILAHFRVDYTDQIPANGGIFPAGCAEVSRRNYLYGGCLVENQYNFGLYYVFEKAPGDDAGALVNADWVMDFQHWVQEQSALGLVPRFGDATLSASAQNGALYAADEEGTATYMVQLSIRYKKEFEVKNQWLKT